MGTIPAKYAKKAFDEESFSPRGPFRVANADVPDHAPGIALSTGVLQSSLSNQQIFLHGRWF